MGIIDKCGVCGGAWLCVVYALPLALVQGNRSKFEVLTIISMYRRYASETWNIADCRIKPQ